jgi:hypothetical protein
MLPRYRYSFPSENRQKGTDEGVMIPILNNIRTSTSERTLLREDAVRNFVLCYIYDLSLDSLLPVIINFCNRNLFISV